MACRHGRPGRPHRPYVLAGRRRRSVGPPGHAARDDAGAGGPVQDAGRGEARRQPGERITDDGRRLPVDVRVVVALHVDRQVAGDGEWTAQHAGVHDLDDRVRPERASGSRAPAHVDVGLVQRRDVAYGDVHDGRLVRRRRRHPGEEAGIVDRDLIDERLLPAFPPLVAVGGEDQVAVGDGGARAARRANVLDVGRAHRRCRRCC